MVPKGSKGGAEKAEKKRLAQEAAKEKKLAEKECKELLAIAGKGLSMLKAWLDKIARTEKSCSALKASTNS